jgi:tetratricopeptide (TPR) repeat protein
MRIKAIATVVIAFSLVFSLSCKQKEEPKEDFGAIKAPVNVEGEIRMLKDVLTRDPKNLNALIKLGNLYMDTGKYQEAVEAYGQALEIDPKNVDVRVDRGTCYRYGGQPEKAVEEYRKALAINPNHVFANKNLAIVLAYDLKKNEEAAKVFENYLKVNPSDPDAAKIREEIQKLRAMK